MNCRVRINYRPFYKLMAFCAYRVQIHLANYVTGATQRERQQIVITIIDMFVSFANCYFKYVSHFMISTTESKDPLSRGLVSVIKTVYIR